MTQPLRLVHASDLHLELPLYGLAEVPDHLRELLIEAPYHAAEQVFETALAEDADAVLLAGDVLNVDRAGPPAIVLLLDQFARLGDRGIPVYWAGGAVDVPDSWPRSVSLPANVHVFPDRPRGNARPGPRRRNDRPRARHELPRRRRSRSPRLSSRRPRPVHDRRRPRHERFGRATKATAFTTWPSAAGICSKPSTSSRASPTTAARRKAAARPKPARTAARSSPSTKRGRAKTQFVATDAVRWIEQALEVTATTRSEQLHDRMVERLEKLQAQHPGIDLFVRWTIRGTGPLVNRLRPGSLADELLVDLRRKFGERSPVAWSVSIDVRLAAQRAGRVVRPGNVPRRFPARSPRVRAARRPAVRPAAIPAGRRPRRIRWPQSPTSKPTKTAPNCCAAPQTRRRSADAAAGRRRHSRRHVDDVLRLAIASRTSRPTCTLP